MKIIGNSPHSWPKIVIHGNSCIILYITTTFSLSFHWRIRTYCRDIPNLIGTTNRAQPSTHRRHQRKHGRCWKLHDFELTGVKMQKKGILNLLVLVANWYRILILVSAGISPFNVTLVRYRYDASLESYIPIMLRVLNIFSGDFRCSILWL